MLEIEYGALFYIQYHCCKSISYYLMLTKHSARGERGGSAEPLERLEAGTEEWPYCPSVVLVTAYR